MCKHRIISIWSALAAALGFHRSRHQDPSEQLADQTTWFVQPRPTDQHHRAERIWRNLGSVLPGPPRPTDVEIQADEYDGSIRLARWLSRGSRKRCGRRRFSRSVKCAH